MVNRKFVCFGCHSAVCLRKKRRVVELTMADSKLARGSSSRRIYYPLDKEVAGKIVVKNFCLGVHEFVVNPTREKVLEMLRSTNSYGYPSRTPGDDGPPPPPDSDVEDADDIEVSNRNFAELEAGRDMLDLLLDLLKMKTHSTCY